MPRNSQAVYTLPSGTLVNSGDTILPSQHNPAMEDIADALTGSLARNGAGGMQDDLPMNGNRITGLADGVENDDAATVGQVLAAGSVQDAINLSDVKATPVDADRFVMTDSEASFVTRRLTWANIKAALKSYFDSIYVPVGRTITTGTGLSGGGHLGANREISAIIASQAQAQAGSNNTTLMTPLRVAQAINSLAVTNSLLGIKAYTSSATYSPTSGTNRALVICTGGGAAGSSDLGSTPYSGGTVIAYATISGNVSVTVGAGSAAPQNGVNPGGNTSFGSVCTAFGGMSSPRSGTGGVLRINGGRDGSFWGGYPAYGASSQGTASEGGVCLVVEFA